MLNSQERDKLGDVNRVLWWTGWHSKLTIVLGLLLLIVGGFILWLLGIWHINQRHESVLEEYFEFVDKRTKTLTAKAEDGVSGYTLTGFESQGFLIKAAERYESTNLLVGDSSVTIFEGVNLNMVSRIPSINDKSREVYYDQVASVSYENPHLEIKTSDGDTLEYKSSREPGDALNDLQQRIREYKSI